MDGPNYLLPSSSGRKRPRLQRHVGKKSRNKERKLGVVTSGKPINCVGPPFTIQHLKHVIINRVIVKSIILLKESGNLVLTTELKT